MNFKKVLIVSLLLSIFMISNNLPTFAYTKAGNNIFAHTVRRELFGDPASESTFGLRFSDYGYVNGVEGSTAEWVQLSFDFNTSNFEVGMIFPIVGFDIEGPPSTDEVALGGLFLNEVVMGVSRQYEITENTTIDTNKSYVKVEAIDAEAPLMETAYFLSYKIVFKKIDRVVVEESRVQTNLTIKGEVEVSNNDLET